MLPFVASCCQPSFLRVNSHPRRENVQTPRYDGRLEIVNRLSAMADTPDPRDIPRDAFDPLICAVHCRRGKDIPYEQIEQQVALALERSGGRITAPVLKPIKKHFEQYMPLPAKSNDPVYLKLEKAPGDPRGVTPDTELELVTHLYRTLKQDFTVSLLMRFANPANFCVISQPIRKAARWMGARTEQKRADLEYVELMRALRGLRDQLGIQRVADLDRGLYSFYYRCLVGDGRRCTNFEALARSRQQQALDKLGEAARSAAGLRRLFQGAQEQLEELDGADQAAFLARLTQAITEFTTNVAEELETRRRQFFQSRSREIGRRVTELAARYPALTHLSKDAARLLAGAHLMWEEHTEGSTASPGLIAVSLGQAFEHELRDVVFSRLQLQRTNGLAYSWLAQNDPVVARHGEAEQSWRAALDSGAKGPKFETLVRLASFCADPALAGSPLVTKLYQSLLRTFPGLADASTPEAYGPASFAADLDKLRELRNRCAHQAAVGNRLGPQAAELVFAPAGMLAGLSR
ncbi:MAG: hypothetical protein ICCCNLDF_02176 [Planctomycetes bacterium]|nr:hypothetical protein [Planctomycetota bacterium]